MMKYDELEMEVVRFSTEDVIDDSAATTEQEKPEVETEGDWAEWL